MLVFGLEKSPTTIQHPIPLHRLPYTADSSQNILLSKMDSNCLTQSRQTCCYYLEITGLKKERHGLGDMVVLTFRFSSQGIGKQLEIPTSYTFRNLRLYVLRDVETMFLTTQFRDNSLLYEHAKEYLGNNLLLNSTILEIQRGNEEGTLVLVKILSGNTLIKSLRILPLP